MRINIQENPAIRETEVNICCAQTDEEILRMVASLRAYDKKLVGTRDGQSYLLENRELLYIDTVDKRTFLYTSNGVYETPLRLYELEDRLAGSDFFRASKSLIINFNRITSMRPDFGGRMLLTMQGGEQLVVSRQYVATIKQKLGL